MKAALLLPVLFAAMAPAPVEAGPAGRLARQLGISKAAARQMLAAPYGARSAHGITTTTAAGPANTGGTGTTQGIAGLGSAAPAQ